MPALLETSVWCSRSIVRQLYAPTFLAVALAADGHSTPVAGAAWVASGLQLSALDNVHAELSRVVDGSGIQGLPGKLLWSGGCESQEADEGDGGGSELHLGVGVGSNLGKSLKIFRG